jgi:hypothetical protein
MGKLSKVINGILVFLASGRYPKTGKIFRVSPWIVDTLIIYPTPAFHSHPSYQKKINLLPQRNIIFLIIKIQEETPLWDLWIHVLVSSVGENPTEETTIGWIPYTEFNRFVLTEWDKWVEEENLKDN